MAANRPPRLSSVTVHDVAWLAEAKTPLLDNKPGTRPTGTRSVEFFFDVGSPTACLPASNLDPVAAHRTT